ncbi:MAG: hypothetical protein KGL39_33885 [Patescibacteria group bacterium]|nr:hypothetical protein [Patescibacteria group bacterium]
MKNLSESGKLNLKILLIALIFVFPMAVIVLADAISTGHVGSTSPRYGTQDGFVDPNGNLQPGNVDAFGNIYVNIAQTPTFTPWPAGTNTATPTITPTPQRIVGDTGFQTVSFDLLSATGVTVTFPEPCSRWVVNCFFNNPGAAANTIRIDYSIDGSNFINSQTVVNIASQTNAVLRPANNLGDILKKIRIVGLQSTPTQTVVPTAIVGYMGN